MSGYFLEISSYGGLVAGARHYRGWVKGEYPKSCHGGTVFSGGKTTCAEGHELPERADWQVEEPWTEERYERFAAAHFEGDGPGQFLDQERLLEVAIGRFTGELPARWWEDKPAVGKPGDKLYLGSAVYRDIDETHTPYPGGPPWGSVLAEIPEAGKQEPADAGQARRGARTGLGPHAVSGSPDAPGRLVGLSSLAARCLGLVLGLEPSSRGLSVEDLAREAGTDQPAAEHAVSLLVRRRLVRGWKYEPSGPVRFLPDTSEQEMEP
jgi:hypothetical protein